MERNSSILMTMLFSFCRFRRRSISAAVMSVLLVGATSCPAVASPVIYIMFASRPVKSNALSSAEGIFLKYTLVEDNNGYGGGALLATLSVFDELKKTVVYYVVNENLRIDGVPLRCDGEGTAADVPFDETINRLHVCKSLPSHLVAGKTRLLLTYWPYSWLGQTQLGVDEIQTLPIDCNLPTIPGKPEATNNSN